MSLFEEKPVDLVKETSDEKNLDVDVSVISELDSENANEEASSISTGPELGNTGRVFITCGANGDPAGYPLVGKTMGFALNLLGPELNAPPKGIPTKGGEEVSRDYILKDNDRIYIPKPSGGFAHN